MKIDEKEQSEPKVVSSKVLSKKKSKMVDVERTIETVVEKIVVGIEKRTDDISHYGEKFELAKQECGIA